MLRVTVPGGQVLVLEMTFVENRFFKFVYYVYLNYLLPAFAKVFSKNPAAYHYLADSIMNFPSPDEFSKILNKLNGPCGKIPANLRHHMAPHWKEEKIGC